MCRRFPALLAALLALALTVACSKKKSARVPTRPAVGWTETGIASWYGHPYHGRKAANGETYDMDLMTAAHRTLPFGALIEVENRDNGKKTAVRITDRGPFVDGRVIDLSRAAAKAIDMIGPGTARVRLKLVAYGPAKVSEPSVASDEGGFGVQVGAFSQRDNADSLKEKIESRFQPVRVCERKGSKTPWRVLVGSKRTEEDARVLAAELKDSFGIEGFVLRLDGDDINQR